MGNRDLPDINAHALGLGHIYIRQILLANVTTIKWRNRWFLQVTENRENYCLCFLQCFVELKYYQRRSEGLFELILAF